MNVRDTNHRVVIYAKDVMGITGKGKRAAYRILKRIRTRYQLPPDAFITIDHFCNFSGIKEERVKQFLQ